MLNISDRPHEVSEAFFVKSAEQAGSHNYTERNTDHRVRYVVVRPNPAEDSCGLGPCGETDTEAEGIPAGM